MSFGVLVLFVSSLAAISLVVVLITATIVVSNTKDLTIIKQERNLPLIMVATAVIVFVIVSLGANPSDIYLFYQVFAINFGVLFVYIFMRLAARDVHRNPKGLR